MSSTASSRSSSASQPLVLAAGAPVAAPAAAAKAKVALPTFKQYREADGRFYFKLAAADGRVLSAMSASGAGTEGTSPGSP